MNGIRVSLPLLLAGLVLGGPAAAQSAAVEGSGRAAATAASETPATKANAAATAQAHASADLAAARERIERRAGDVARRARERADARLEAASRRVDREAREHSAAVEGRLAGELGITAEALAAQRAQLDASWGTLMVAHSLEQNAGAAWTVEQLVALRHDGLGWGQIAAGLGLELGSVTSGIDHEARVALGQVRADGRVSSMVGSAARVDGTVGASAGAGASAAGVAGVGSSAGAGLGAGLGLGR